MPIVVGRNESYTFFERRHRNNQKSLDNQTFFPEQEIDEISAWENLDTNRRNIFEDDHV